MKSKKMLASLLAVTMVASVGLVGCGNKDDGGNAKKDTEGTASKTDELDAEQHLSVIFNEEPKTVDPSKATDLYSSQITTNTQEALTRISEDENGNDTIVPGMAEKWETSDDGLTWTFHLRDAQWSDGQPVKAEDYRYAVLRTLNPDTASSYAFLLSPIKNADEYNGDKASADDVGIKAKDDKTLEITLKNPCPYFLKLTYFKVFSPQRKDIVEQYGETFGTEANTLVFSGPYTMKEWVHNSKVELVKNDKYWDADNVKLDGVSMNIIAETNSRMQSLYNGSVDIGAVSKPEWIEKLDGTNDFDVLKKYGGDVTYTLFNEAEEYNGEKNIFANKKVRQAFAIAQDREKKIEVLRKGIGEPAYAWIPPMININDKEYRDQYTDLPIKELAEKNKDPKALLIEGLKELGLGEDPSKVTVHFLYAGTDTQAKEWAEYEQQEYQEKLGINLEIEYVEWAQFSTRVDELDYQMGSQAWGGDYDDPSTFLEFIVSDTGMCPTGWVNKEYDDLVTKAASETDGQKRADMYHDAEKILLDECSVIPECWRTTNTYKRKCVKGYVSPIFGTPDYKGVYISGRK